MIYGDAKVREMMRSVLPSTARKQARSRKNRLHRADRRRVKHALRNMDEWYELDAVPTGEDSWDDIVVPVDFHVEPWLKDDIRYIVRERRGADKVNPLIEWAEARTKDMPRENRLSTIRALLPHSTIGDHALGHLEGRSHFENANEKALHEAQKAYNEQFYRDSYSREHYTEADYEALLYRACCDSRLHRMLNEFVLSTFGYVEENVEKQEVKCLCGYRRFGRGIFDYGGYTNAVHYSTGQYKWNNGTKTEELLDSDMSFCPTKKLVPVIVKVQRPHPERRHFKGMGDIKPFIALLKKVGKLNALGVFMDKLEAFGHDITLLENELRNARTNAYWRR